MSESARDLVVSLSLNASKFSDRIKNVHSQIKDAQAAFRSAGAGVDGFEKSIVGMRAGISTLETKLRLQKQAVDQYAGALQAAEARLLAASDKQKQLTAAQTAAQQKSDELKAKVAAADQQYNAFKNTLGATDSATVAAKQNLDALSAEYKSAKDDVRKLDGQISSNARYIQRNADSVQRLSTELKNAEASVKETTAALKQQQGQLQTAQSAWTKAGAAAEAFYQKCAAVSPKLAAVGRTMTQYITTPILALGAAAIKASVDYESAFADVRKTVDATEEEYDTLSASVKQMSTEVGTVPEEIAKVVANAGQLGIAKDNLVDFTHTMIDLGNSTDIAADEAAVTIAQYANVTNMAQGDIGRFGSALVDLGNNFATTESSVMNMASRIGAAGSQVGLTQAQILGFSTGLTSVGLEAQAGGTAFSKAMIAMQVAAETGNDQLKDFARVMGVTAEAFRTLWKESPAEAIQKFIVGLSKMDEQGISSIATLEEMGFSEARLRDTLLRATSASELFARAQTTASASWQQNSALTEEAGKRYATTEYQLKSLKNTAMLFGQQIGDDLNPVLRSLADDAGKLLEKFGEMDATQRLQIVKWGGIAAAAGPALLVFGKLTTGVGSISKAFGTFSTAVGTAGGGFKGLMGVVGKSPLTWIALTAAVVAGTAALIDYASGAKEAREALEGMNDTARNWAGRTAKTLYDGEGLSFFGLDADTFAQSARETGDGIDDWANTVIQSWKKGENKIRWNTKTGSVDYSNNKDMLALFRASTAGDRETVADKDLEALDALDAAIEKLMTKRVRTPYTEDEIKELERLVQEREALVLKYKLTPEKGFDGIVKGVEKEVARAWARGETDAGVTVYEEATLAAAQGLEAINDQLDAEYDKQYDIIQLMEDGAEKDAARAALDAKYAADRQKAYEAYAATLKQVIEPVVKKDSFTKSSSAMTELLAKLREYGKAGGDVKPALLTELNEFVEGMNEDEIVEYVALLGQLQALTQDGGMTQEELQAMFPDLDVDGLLGQIVEIEEFLKNRPEGLEGLNKLFADLGKEVEQIMVDLDMTKASEQWAQFAENPGAVTVTIDKYEPAETVEIPEPTTTGVVESYKELTDGADKEQIMPTGLTGFVVGYVEQNGGANTDNLTPDDLTAVVNAYKQAEKDVDFSGLTPPEVEARVIGYLQAAGYDISKLKPGGVTAIIAAYLAAPDALKPSPTVSAFVNEYLKDPKLAESVKNLTATDVEAIATAYVNAIPEDERGKLTAEEIQAKVTKYIQDNNYVVTDLTPTNVTAVVTAYEQYAQYTKDKLVPTGVWAYVVGYLTSQGVDISKLTPPSVEALITSFADMLGIDKDKALEDFTAYINQINADNAVRPKITVDVEISPESLQAVLDSLRNNPTKRTPLGKLFFGDDDTSVQAIMREVVEKYKAYKKLDEASKGGMFGWLSGIERDREWNETGQVLGRFGSDNVTSMLSFLAEYIAAVESGAEISDEAKASFNSVIEFIEVLSVMKPEGSENILASIVEGLKELGADTSVETLLEDLKTLTQGMPDEVSGVAKELPDELTSIANNSMASWKSGVEKGTPGVVEAYANAAEEALRRVKEKFGIASPSRVFRDQIGRMTIRGFAEGITLESKEQSRVIRNAARYLTGEAAAGAGIATMTTDRRSYDQSSTVQVTGNTFSIRDEQDVYALAAEMAALTRRRQRGRGVRMA